MTHLVQLHTLERATNASEVMEKLECYILTKGFILNISKDLFYFISILNSIKITVSKGIKQIIPEYLLDAVAQLGYSIYQKLMKYLGGCLWFRKMHEMLEKFGKGCISCHASSRLNRNDPDKYMKERPNRPWE